MIVFFIFFCFFWFFIDFSLRLGRRRQPPPAAIEETFAKFFFFRDRNVSCSFFVLFMQHLSLVNVCYFLVDDTLFTHVHIHTHTYAHTHTHARTHTHTHIHTNTNTHTHTGGRLSSGKGTDSAQWRSVVKRVVKSSLSLSLSLSLYKRYRQCSMEVWRPLCVCA